jgi:V8-like Glu-specific endopeptidase
MSHLSQPKKAIFFLSLSAKCDVAGVRPLTRSRRLGWSALFFAAAAPFAVGCASEDGADEGVIDDAIIGTQSSATAYPEAVLIQVNNAAADFCSGVIVAPNVVLTAAHCVVFNPKGAGALGTWTVKAPFAAGGAQTRTASRGEPMEAAFYARTYANYTSTTTLHDLAVVYLDTPFTGITPPTLSSTARAAATTVRALGRKAVAANTSIVASAAIPLQYTTPADGFVLDYKTTRVTDGGDSGGPLFVNGTHTLVGTETRFDTAKNLDYWSRIEGAVYTWVQGRIASVSSAAIAQFQTDQANAFCGVLKTACGNPGLWRPAKCTGIYQSGFANLFEDLTVAGVTAGGRLSYDSAKGTACINAINAVPMPSRTAAQHATVVSACKDVVTGTQAIGAACRANVECAPGAACKNIVAGAGTCAAIDALGASCTFSASRLRSNSCSYHGNAETGRYCSDTDGNGVCENLLAVGAACLFDTQCASNLCGVDADMLAAHCVNTYDELFSNGTCAYFTTP